MNFGVHSFVGEVLMVVRQIVDFRLCINYENLFPPNASRQVSDCIILPVSEACNKRLPADREKSTQLPHHISLYVSSLLENFFLDRREEFLWLCQQYSMCFCEGLDIFL